MSEAAAIDVASVGKSCIVASLLNFYFTMTQAGCSSG
jgi:hypothetical protein